MNESTLDDPFALLNLPRAFELTAAQIEHAYLSKAASLHPDHLSDPLGAASAEAVRESARINDARRILLDDESRARALLRLLGGEAKERSEELPEGFLAEILEVREEMEEDAGNAQARQRWEDWAREQRREYLGKVAELFGQASDGSLPTDVAASIRRELNALRYIERMIEQLDPGNSAATD